MNKLKKKKINKCKKRIAFFTEAILFHLLEAQLKPAVPFRKWLRFPRGPAGASSATPVGSPPSAISLRTRKASAAKHRTKKMRSIFEESSPFAPIHS
ncbi:hypothetical protein AAV98_06360 [Bacillus sp. CHD6a]|nr:hypothetical protein AAV98_06360 [Bacillus sp. CHD6a]